MRKVKIYCVFDKRTDSPIYIGATIGKLASRLLQHFSGGIKWVCSLENPREHLDIKLLQECHFSEAIKCEQYYIDKFIDMGYNIVNTKAPYKNTIKDSRLWYTDEFVSASFYVSKDLEKELYIRAAENEMNIDHYVSTVLTNAAESRVLLPQSPIFKEYKMFFVDSVKLD